MLWLRVLGAIPQRALWLLRIEMFPSFFDDDLRFPQAVEYLTVEQFISKFTIRTLAIAVFPGAARFDVGCLTSHS